MNKTRIIARRNQFKNQHLIVLLSFRVNGFTSRNVIENSEYLNLSQENIVKHEIIYSVITLQPHLYMSYFENARVDIEETNIWEYLKRVLCHTRSLLHG